MGGVKSKEEDGIDFNRITQKNESKTTIDESYLNKITKIDPKDRKGYQLYYYGIKFQTKFSAEELFQMIDFCKFDSKNVQFLDLLDEKINSNSREGKGIIEINEKEMKVFVKLYNLNFIKELNRGNGVLIEQIIMSTVISQVVEFYSPHFPYYYGTKNCFVDNVSEDTLKLFQTLKLKVGKEFTAFELDEFGFFPKRMKTRKEKNLLDSSASTNEITVTISENFEGIPFGEFLQLTDVTNRDKKKAIFQVLWSIMILNKIGINHNDLHLNNILVNISRYEREVLYLYEYEGYNYTFAFETKYFIKIINFEQATWPGILSNTVFSDSNFESIFTKERNNILSVGDIYKFLKSALSILLLPTKSEDSSSVDPTQYWSKFKKFYEEYEITLLEEINYFRQNSKNQQIFSEPDLVDWYTKLFQAHFSYYILLPQAFYTFQTPVKDLKRFFPFAFGEFSFTKPDLILQRQAFIYREPTISEVQELKEKIQE